MIKNLLKSAYRNFIKHKTFTILNILGLSIGLAACILIFQYVKYENSYDTFHSNADNIYRVQYNMIQNGKKTVECAAAVPAVGPALLENFPQVVNYTRLYPLNDVLTYQSSERGSIAIRQEHIQIADPALFEIFDFKLLSGDIVTALDGPNKIIITQSVASSYFQDEEPMGKILQWDSGAGIINFIVTGILDEVPDNSHIKFDILFSAETWNQLEGSSAESSWTWYDYYTFIQLEENTKPEDFIESFEVYLAEERADHWRQYNYSQEFIFQPVKDIHLKSHLLQEAQPQEQGDADSIYFLSIIALFILIIAWVNYVNLSTAKSVERANEVGVRKVLGAESHQLWKQFLLEAFLTNMLAIVGALLLVALLWNSFLDISSRHIPAEYFLAPDFLLLVFLTVLIGSLMSGLYPAFLLSSYQPISVLKSKPSNSRGNLSIRKGLVIFQFITSIVLISGTFIVYEQLKFMKNSELGFSLNNTLILQGPSSYDSLYDNKVEIFKNELKDISGIKTVAVSSTIPGDQILWSRGIRRIGGGPENNITVYNVGIDSDYIPLFDMEMVAGRNFDSNNIGDDDRIIINRHLADMLEFEEVESAVGEYIRMGRDTIEIVGVVENYHQMSLNDEIAAISFQRWYSNAFYSIKLETDNYKEVLAAIEKPWNSIFPGNPIDHFYLNTFFNRQYEKDDRFGQVFAIFSLLAIFVACLGLFGLASLMTIQRTKEIGVRKVLGSSVSNIIGLLSRGFIQLVLIANVIAFPLCWWLMNSWLETFPYRIEINPLLFIVAGTGVIIISFLAVSFQTFKAALINPSKSLKYE